MAYCKCNDINEFIDIVQRLDCSKEVQQLLLMIQNKNLKECEYENECEELYYLKNGLRYSNKMIMVILENCK